MIFWCVKSWARNAKIVSRRQASHDSEEECEEDDDDYEHEEEDEEGEDEETRRGEKDHDGEDDGMLIRRLRQIKCSGHAAARQCPLVACTHAGDQAKVSPAIPETGPRSTYKHGRRSPTEPWCNSTWPRCPSITRVPIAHTKSCRKISFEYTARTYCVIDPRTAQPRARMSRLNR